MSVLSKVSILGCVTALSGCAPNYLALDIPQTTGPYGSLPTTDSITQRIRCELAALVGPRVPGAGLFKAYAAAVTVNLDVTDKGAVAPSLTYALPPLSFAAGASVDATRDSSVSIDLTYDMAQIAEAARNDWTDDGLHLRSGTRYACPDASTTHLDGELGLTTAALVGMNADDRDPTSAKEEFGGEITFTLEGSLDAFGPSWTLRRFQPVKLGLTASQTNTDKITFSFARKTPVKLLPFVERGGGPKVAAAPHTLTDAAASAASRARDYNQYQNLNQISTTLSKINNGL